MRKRSAKTAEARDQPPVPVALAGSEYMSIPAYASLSKAPGYSYLDRMVQESPRTVGYLPDDEYTKASFTPTEDSLWPPGALDPRRVALNHDKPRRSKEHSERQRPSTRPHRLKTIDTSSSLANYKDALLDEDEVIARRVISGRQVTAYDPIPTRLPRSRPSPVRAGLEKAGLETSYKLVRKDATKRKELSFRYKTTRRRPPTPRPVSDSPSRTPPAPPRPVSDSPSRKENAPPPAKQKESSLPVPFESFDLSRLAACVPVEDVFSAPKPPVAPKTRKRTKSISDGTKVELIKLKRELRSLKRTSTSRSGSLGSGSSSSGKTKRVHFAKPLVTLITQRPYTDPKDIEKLYFGPEELEELEWDRETTEWHQIECVAQQNSPDSSADLSVSVSFQYAAEEDMIVAAEDDLSASSLDESAME